MISVIVPVYKVEAYLPRCIESILNQTYTDFELLLVDDGSPDCCGEICEEYAKKDARIRVFHKENGGQADARNYALDRMRGDSITFVDSDDYIGKDYLLILKNMMDEHQADISILNIEFTKRTDMAFIESENLQTVMNREEAFKEMLLGSKYYVSPWSKLYAKSLFEDSRFSKGKVYEDLMLIPYIFAKCNRCVYSTSKQYYYYAREGSTILSSTSVKKSRMWIEGMDKLIRFTEQNYPQYSKYVAASFTRTVFRFVIDWLLLSDEYITIAGEIKRSYRHIFFQAWDLPNLNLKQRIKATLFLLNIRFYRIVRIQWIKKSNNPDNMRFLQK